MKYSEMTPEQFKAHIDSQPAKLYYYYCWACGTRVSADSAKPCKACGRKQGTE